MFLLWYLILLVQLLGHSTLLRINPSSVAELEHEFWPPSFLGLKSGRGLAVETSVVGPEGKKPFDPKTLFLVLCLGDDI